MRKNKQVQFLPQTIIIRITVTIMLMVALMGCGATSEPQLESATEAEAAEIALALPTPDKSLQPELAKVTVPTDDIVTLLPQDAIQSILPNQVQYIMVTAAEANEIGMFKDLQVMGISINGESHAYPISFLSQHEIVNAEIGGQLIAATWWPLCYTGIVYDRQIDPETTLTFGVSGMLYQNSMIMYDHKTESLWSHILGQAIDGAYTGTTLTFLPALQTTWGVWQERHPDSLVVSPDIFSGVDMYDTNGYYTSRTAGVLGSPNPDTRLPTKEYVIGIRLKGEVKAYPFSTLNEEPVINDEMAEIPLGIFFDKTAASGAVFDRRLPDGTVLIFEPGPELDIVVDTNTQTQWDIFTGTALEGELSGTQLSQIPITYAFWFGWSDYHQDGQIYGE